MTSLSSARISRAFIVSDAMVQHIIEGRARTPAPIAPVAVVPYGLLSFVRDCALTVAMAGLMLLAMFSAGFAADSAPSIDPARYSLVISHGSEFYAVDGDMTFAECMNANPDVAEFYPGLWLKVAPNAARYCAAQ